MGGGDLNMKKSWHVFRRDNQEMVWKREQEVAQEEKRTEELRKQLKEERQIEELRRVQEQASGIKRRERVDWLYEGAIQVSNPEEFLLGKPVEDKQDKEELQKLSRSAGTDFISGMDKVGASLPGARDALSKMKEDPMVSIKRLEIEARKRVLKNPLNKQRMLERLEKAEQKKLEKKRRKEEKRERKEKRKRGRDSRSVSPPPTRHHSSRHSPSDSKRSRRSPSPPRSRDSERPAASSAPNRFPQGPDRRQGRAPARPRLTEAERQERLRQMEADGRASEQQRTSRLKDYRKRETAEEPNAEGQANKSARFIERLQEDSYLGSDQKIEEHLKRRAYSRQTNGDAFMSRS